jgi:hypothetical protein
MMVSARRWIDLFAALKHIALTPIEADAHVLHMVARGNHGLAHD